MKAGALLTAAACVLALPATAAAGMMPLAQSPAAGTYTDAEPANTVGFSCSSLAAGAATLVPDTLIALGVQGTPRAGDVFYVRLTATVLDDPCTGGTTVLPEVLPPKGVAVAIDAAHPVLLRYDAFDGDNVDDAAVKVKPGQMGGTEFDAISTRAPDGEPFPILKAAGRWSSTCRCGPRGARARPTRSTSSTTSATARPRARSTRPRAPLGRARQAGRQGRQEGGADRHHRAGREGHRDADGRQEEGRQRQGDRQRGRHGQAQAEGQARLKRAKLTLKTTLTDGSKAPRRDAQHREYRPP